MKFKTKLILLVTAILTASTIFAAAATVGSSGDPLVTLSYLNDTYTDSIMNKVDSKISERNASISTGGSTASSGFTLVTLSSGQKLNAAVGTEILLRVGTANCYADSAPGLIDTTDGTTINNGAAITKNHLYMSTIENRGVTATAATVKVMVRGSYTVS